MTLRFFVVIAVCVLAFSAFAAPASSDSGPTAIAVPARDIPRGTVITVDDLALMPAPASRLNAAFIRDMGDAIGKEARRALRMGEVMRASDLKRPALVAKGSTVTMIFETKGMALTAQGRALAEGGAGDGISVLNPTSYRKVEATVIGPGLVRVEGPRLPTLANTLADAKP